MQGSDQHAGLGPQSGHSQIIVLVHAVDQHAGLCHVHYSQPEVSRISGVEVPTCALV